VFRTLFKRRKCTEEDITTNLLGLQFIEYGIALGGGKDFDPLISMAPQLHYYYKKLVRFAALQIPLKLKEPIKPECFGLVNTPIKVITQEVLRVYNLHILHLQKVYK
jgi:hypothetical protein